MTEVLGNYLGHNIEQLSGELSDNDHLTFAGVYRQAHPERGTGIPLPELREKLETYTDHANEHKALFVARSHGMSAIVGAAIVRIAESTHEKVAHIEEIFVKENARGKKLGKGLLKACLDFAEQHRVDAIQLVPDPENDEAVNLFTKMDFMSSPSGYRLALDSEQ